MSFKGYKKSIVLGFDYKEVREGIPNVSKQMAVLNAEFRKSSAEAQISGKEIDKLGTRYDYLSNKIKIQQQDVENYRKKLETATNAKGNNTKAIENNTASLQIAEARLAQTKAQLDGVTKELEKQKTTLGKTSEEWKDLSEKTTEIGKSMTMKLTAPILAAAGASFKLGADFEQALGKMDVVFGESSGRIEQWSKSAFKNFGLAQITAVAMVSDFGALFKGMGMTMQQTEEWSKTLTERTMDLSNFYDTSVEETTNALNAIVTGQTEPLRKFGINMTQAALQEYAFASGIRKKVADMTEAEKVQLRYNFVIEKTNIAVGTTARESDSATAQMTKFKEGVKELGTSFSEHIMPIFTPVIEGVNNMIEKFAGLSDGTKKFIVVASGIVGSIGPALLMLGGIFKAISNISDGMKVAKGAIEGVSKVGGLFSGVLSNSAFFGFAKWALIIAGVALAIAALVMSINYLLGKGKEMNQFANDMGKMVSDVGGAVNNTGRRAYAIGTNYAEGGEALVGEHGPERMVIPRGAKIYDAGTTKHMGDMEQRSQNASNQEIADKLDKLVDVVMGIKQEVYSMPQRQQSLSRMGIAKG